MKKIIISVLPYLLIAGFVSCTFMACKKKEPPEYPIEVTVRFKHSDLAVEGAEVSIIKNDIRVEELLTNSKGIILYSFDLPAILDVFASYDTNTVHHSQTDPPLTGSTVIKLEENTVVKKTVYIQ